MEKAPCTLRQMGSLEIKLAQNDEASIGLVLSEYNNGDG